MSNTEQPESTVNEYLTRVRDDNRPGVVRPLFEENIKFEFWGQCIDELKNNVFLGNNNKNPLEHISHIISIVNLFQSPGVLRDQVMLMAFPFTLKGKNQTLDKSVVSRLDLRTRKKADFMGPIPRMTPATGIKAIDELSKHSLSWYKEEEDKENDFDKDLLSRKGKGSKASKIILNEKCSAFVLNKVPLKEKVPGGFTIPCVIGQSEITRALADLGASISLMPYSMFLRLNLGDLKPTRMCIELANKTTQFPKGIAENVM
ncbi:reverse transcriptase domain-containing protein, partial [Tanacetum coccineum]